MLFCSQTLKSATNPFLRLQPSMSSRDPAMSTVEQPVWLDKTFLETSLRSEYGNTLRVAKYGVTVATAKGDNYTSTMYRVTIETTSNKTFTVVIKNLIGSGVDGCMLRQSSAFVRETRMLNVMLPRLAALLRDAIPAEPFGARYIFSTDGVIIMEDLTPLGFRMVNRGVGLDLAHCLVVMRRLATFHAASVILYQQDPECMTPFLESLFSESVNEKQFQQMISGLMKRVRVEVETWPDFSHFARKLRALEKDVLGRMCRGMRRDDKAFNVLNHGDAWKNNMLFRYSDTGQPESVIFVDYQLSHLTSPAVDLRKFIYTSPTEDVRMRHENTLLQVRAQKACSNTAFVARILN
ncbi:hypothetical protein B7P43_G12439 [Cryptotermes secundus]|uniref:CHK kinase-like domain-containing protein n=1 Tax=Cryptotermes secundus TaxID=105785 RepID=A0A2J7PBV8_9NEOP|nr:hypothetical protein B7P43_G12439 [Cryptotermes secundus]